MRTSYACDNCDFETDDEGTLPALGDCADIHERLETGGIVPAGECPECGSFVYRIDARQRLVDAAPDLLEALRECITDDPDNLNTGRKSRRLNAISEIARAAIKKAETGETAPARSVN